MKTAEFRLLQEKFKQKEEIFYNIVDFVVKELHRLAGVKWNIGNGGYYWYFPGAEPGEIGEPRFLLDRLNIEGYYNKDALCLFLKEKGYGSDFFVSLGEHEILFEWLDCECLETFFNKR